MLDLVAHLPFRQEVLKQESERLASEAESALANILLRGSSRSVLPSVSFLSLKHAPPPDQLARIGRLLFKIFENSVGDITTEARTAKALGQVLRLLAKTPGLPAHEAGRLHIPWRPIYECLLRVALRGGTWESCAAGESDEMVGGEAAKFHYQSLLALARRARNFFSLGAAEEILDELRPYLCPHDERSFLRATALLSWFLPDEVADPASLLTEFVGVWEQTGTSNETNMLWFGIFSRLVRHHPHSTITPLQPLLPRLFSSLLRMLSVPTGKKAASKPDNMAWPADLHFLIEGRSAKKAAVKKFVRLIVYSIGPGSDTLDRLAALIAYVRPFYHPLNEGDHSEALNELLAMLAINTAKRIGVELGVHHVKKPWCPPSKLSDYDCQRLVSMLLPLAMESLRSKDSTTSFGASVCIKDLACICPDLVVPEVSTMLLPAMDNVMKPHEVQSAIMLTSTMAMFLVRTDEGIDQIGQILRMTVPGIDLNDPHKSMYTFRMFMSVMSQLPLMHPNDMPHSVGKPDMVYGLQEWVVEIIDRILSVLENVPSMKKGFYMGQVLSGTIGRFFDVLMQQMSPTLHATALERITRKVSTTLYPPAQKFVGAMVDSCVFSSPAEGLKALIPAICSKIVANGVLNASESEAVYYTHLLGHALRRAGPHSLPYDELVEAVLDAVVLHEKKEYAKEGQKALRKYLKGLVDVVPADNRSLPPSKWGADKISRDFASVCGAPVAPRDMEVTFRVPTEECLARARKLVEKYCTAAMNVLKDGGSSKADEMRVALACMSNVVRGAGVLFPPQEAPNMDFQDGEEESDEGDEDQGDNGAAVCGLAKVVDTRNDGGWGQGVRGLIGGMLLEFCRKHAKAENPDVVTLKLAVRLVQVFLANSNSAGKWNTKKSAASYNKSLYRNWTNGQQQYYRDIVVNRVHALLLRRQHQGVLQSSLETDELINVVVSLCMHEYSLVRKKAQKALKVIVKRYPLAGDAVVSRALAVISTPTSTKGAVNGAIYTVQNAWGLRKVSRHWGLYKAFMVALLESRGFEDSKVQVRLAEMWNAYVPYAFPTPLHGPAHPQSLITDQDVAHAVGSHADRLFAAGEGALERRKVACSRTYAEVTKVLEDALLGTGAAGALHWRFVILASSALTMLMRKDVTVSKTCVQGYIKNLDSEILSLRQLCRIAVPTLQVCEKLSRRANEGEVDAMDIDGGTVESSKGPGGVLLTPESFEGAPSDPEAGPFIDQIWHGWNKRYSDGDADTSFESITMGSDDGEWAMVSSFTAAVIAAFADEGYVMRVCDKMSQDHRLNGDERAEQASAGFPGMPVASTAVTAVATARWPLPSAWSGAAFNVFNMQVFKAVAQAGGAKACEHLWGVLDKAVKATSDQEQQCLAAEMVAGLIRGSMGWEGGYAQSLRERLRPLIKEVCATVSSESLSYWQDCFRFIATQRDPRRLSWVNEIIVSMSPDDNSGSPAQLRALKMFSSVTLEYTWRALSLFRPVLPTLKRLCKGESKTVREDASRALAIVTRLLTPLSRCPHQPRPPTEVPRTPELVSSWLPQELAQLQQRYITFSFAQGTPEKKLFSNEIEGTIFYFIHATRLGWSASVCEMMPGAMELMFAVQEDSDRELAQVGKMGLELCATSVPNDTVASLLIDTAERTLKSAPSWRVRSACIDFVRECGHTCVLGRDVFSRVVALIEHVGLVDSVPEVRQTACASLAGFLRVADEQHVKELISKAPKPKRRGAKSNVDAMSDEDKAKDLIARHAKVLGVCACVLSHPTELPEWMADAVTSLCRLQGEDTIIHSFLAKTVSDFKKSHQDVWTQVQTTWTEDQLTLLSDLGGSHTYYS